MPPDGRHPFSPDNKGPTSTPLTKADLIAQQIVEILKEHPDVWERLVKDYPKLDEILAERVQEVAAELQKSIRGNLLASALRRYGRPFGAAAPSETKLIVTTAPAEPAAAPVIAEEIYRFTDHLNDHANAMIKNRFAHSPLFYDKLRDFAREHPEYDHMALVPIGMTMGSTAAVAREKFALRVGEGALAIWIIQGNELGGTALRVYFTGSPPAPTANNRLHPQDPYYLDVSGYTDMDGVDRNVEVKWEALKKTMLAKLEAQKKARRPGPSAPPAPGGPVR